ncbi:MAG: 2-hydroxyacid dehydrogenase family protein [Tissierellia bacterium]|nr:2-hydroxyacid dehydrogenase family protein [Tissierellia bacterium]
MKLFISSQIPQEILDRLDGFDISYHNSNVPLSKEALIEGIKEADALLCPLSDKIDAEVLDAGKHLKIVANYGAGFDNIDIDRARDLGIVVTNAPAPSSAVSTAELAFGLILATARRFSAGERNLREGKFQGWRPSYFLGQELKGKTLGIIGMGNIGKNLAKRALAFEMKLIYWSRNRKEDIEAAGASYVALEDLLKQADIISLHTAYVPELHHLMDQEAFKAMKTSALFINAARGPLVDEKALADALKAGEIAGAGLDVYEFEPQVREDLLGLDQVTLLPHLGNATHEARLEMGHAAADNLLALKNGQKPKNQVN